MANEKDRKSGAANALNKFLEKDWREQQKMNGLIKKRTHGKPEKDVEKECVTWMRAQGWAIEIYESKATQVNGVWRQQSMKAGHPDSAGTMRDGTAVYVEFKAPGKLSTFKKLGNERQVAFIKERIEMNCFACVVDSVDLLKHIYDRWSALRSLGPLEAKRFLEEVLP